MKKLLFVYLFFLFFFNSYSKTEQVVDFVNPLIGSALKGDGGVSPFVGNPFAMTNFTVQTRENKISSMPYVYDDHSIIGFLATRQPAVWMGDYGYVSVMPQILKNIEVLPEKRHLQFDHKDEVAKPYYYSVIMNTGDGRKIQGEIAAGSRCGMMRFTFPKSINSHIIIQGINLNPALSDWCNDYTNRLLRLKGWVKIDTSHNEIIGYNPDRQSAQLGPDLPNFKGYFVIQFNKKMSGWGTWSGSEIYKQQTEQSGTRMGAYISFSTKENEKVMVRIATSLISIEQARQNLGKEIPDWNFENLVASTKQKWETKLSAIQVDHVSFNDKAVFYTALYHCYQFPRDISEYGRYYSAYDDKIHDGFSFTDYSLWDTFRAFHPLMTLLEPKLTGDWITGFLHMYQQGGWMPMWPNPAETNIMIGTHADAVVSDAYMKGIRNYDVKLAYEAMRKDAMVPPDCDTQRKYSDREPWTSFEGRAGASYYHSIGYIPVDKTSESVSRTLEYGLDDWCIAQVAKDMGKDFDYEQLIRWSKNYKNIYNKDVGFMQPRKYNGDWVITDDNDHTGMTEGSKWTYLFCVMQDIPGMIQLMGGNEKFAAKLDRNFNGKHYQHDNEPGHHYIYLYDYCDQPWKAQELVRNYTGKNYLNAPDGLIGNDDLGQMSAWYLFSTMGFYPVTSGSNEFAIGAPQFPLIKIKFPVNNNQLTIRANNLSKENKYVKSVYLDNKRIEKPFINYFDLIKATELRFEMTDKPVADAFSHTNN
jgi:predicted alpha-1,2-mannosidase